MLYTPRDRDLRQSLQLGVLLVGWFVLPTFLNAVDQGGGRDVGPSRNHASTDQTHRDSNGNSLPDGAIGRLGSLHLHPGGDVSDVRFAPNGRLLASSNAEGVIGIWDAKTGQLIRELKGHVYSVSSIAFSPDSTLLVSGGTDRTARIWEVQTGKQLHVLRGHRFGESGLVHGTRAAFTPDGVAVVTGGLDGVIQVWNVQTGKAIKRFQPEVAPRARFLASPERITALSVSPEAQFIAAAGFDNTIRVWNRATDRLEKTVSVESYWIYDLAFSPDGRILAWCGRSREQEVPSEGIVLLDWMDQRRALDGHDQHRTYGIAFSPDGKRIASCGLGNTVKLWDVVTGEEIWSARGHTNTPWQVAFSPDGESVASCSRDGSIRIWNARNGEERVHNAGGHRDKVLAMAVTPAGDRVLLASKDRRVREIDLRTGKTIRSFAISTDFNDLGFSPNAEFLALGHGNSVDLFDVKTGNRIWSRSEFGMQREQPRFQRPYSMKIAFSRDSKLLACTTSGHNRDERRTVIRIWDVTSGVLISQVDRPTTVSAGPTFSADGSTLSVCEYNTGPAGGRTTEEATRLFDTKTGDERADMALSQSFSSLAVSSDGNLRAAGTFRSLVQFWDSITNELLFSLQGPRHTTKMTRLAFSPDGTRLAAASQNPRHYQTDVIYVWEIATGKLTHQFLSRADCLAFLPDGNRLLTGHADGTLLLWDVDSARQDLRWDERISREALTTLWEQLAYGRDSSQGTKVVDKPSDAMVEGEDDTVAFLEEHLLDPNLEQKNHSFVQTLIDPLTSKSQSERESGIKRLVRFGDAVHAFVERHRVLDEPLSNEHRHHLESELLENLETRRHRAIVVLMQIGTRSAERLLDKVSPEYLTSIRKLKLRKAE